MFPPTHLPPFFDCKRLVLSLLMEEVEDDQLAVCSLLRLVMWETDHPQQKLS